MTTTETTTEAAFWAAISERPEDGLRRKVFADWLDEQAGTVECGRCAPPRALPPYHWTCPTCSGTGRVSNGRAELARALRATADRVPVWNCDRWWWKRSEKKNCEVLQYGVYEPVFDALKPDANGEYEHWRQYSTAETAIRDLCRAWIAVHGGA